MKHFIVVLYFAALFAGCSSTSEYSNYLFDMQPDLEKDSLHQAVINDFSEYLNGVKFFIDPGHGGEDRHNKSKNEMVVEADANLNVALYLRDFLEASGAIVEMSRITDQTVDLHYRSVLADSSRADIFISIHHNAPGGRNRGWINFTSTYYHATEFDYEYEPMEHDLARFIQRDIAFAMGNSGGLGSFDGTYSDYWIYPGAGFSVLRRTEIPAVLVECSFFTHDKEEARLQLKEFNRLQAWGIYKGIAKFFRTGFPEIEFVENESSLIAGETKLVFNLDDKNGIDYHSIKTYIDSIETNFIYNPVDQKLVLLKNEIKPGEHEVRIICANNRKVHAFPYSRKIVIK